MTQITLPHAGKRTWKVFIHDREDTVPEGTVRWLDEAAGRKGGWARKGGYATAGGVLGYLKRYARYNGGFAVWHVYPLTFAEGCGETLWSLNVGSDLEDLAAYHAAQEVK